MSSITTLIDMSILNINNSLKNLTNGNIVKYVFIGLIILFSLSYASTGFAYTTDKGSKITSTVITSLIILFTAIYWKYNYISASIYYTILFILLITQQIIIVASSGSGTKIQFDGIIFTIMLTIIIITNYVSNDIMKKVGWMLITILGLLFLVFNGACSNTDGYSAMIGIFGIVFIIGFLLSLMKMLEGNRTFLSTFSSITVICIIFFTFYLTANIDSTQSLISCDSKISPNKHIPTQEWYDQIKMPETEVSQEVYDSIMKNTDNLTASNVCGKGTCDDLWMKITERDATRRINKDNIDTYLDNMNKPSLLKYIMYQLLKCGLKITGGEVAANFGTWEWIKQTWFSNPTQGIVYVIGLVLYLVFSVYFMIKVFASGVGYGVATMIFSIIVLIIIVILTTGTTANMNGIISYPFVIIGIMIIIMIITKISGLDMMKRGLMIYVLGVIIAFNMYYTIFIPPMMVVLTFLQKIMLQTSIGFGSGTSILNTLWKFGITLGAIIYSAITATRSSETDNQEVPASTGNALTWSVVFIIVFILITNIWDIGFNSEKIMGNNGWSLVLVPFANMLINIGGGDVDIDNLTVSNS